MMRLLSFALEERSFALCALLSLCGPTYSDHVKAACGLSFSSDASNMLTDDILKLLETITNLDDGNQRIQVNNSRVLVETPAIRKIVQRGPAVVPSLIALMRHDALTFDTFTRLYSACDQILRRADQRLSVFWSGGCEVREPRKGVARIFPRGQKDERTFRRKVVADIVKKYQEWRRENGEP